MFILLVLLTKSGLRLLPFPTLDYGHIVKEQYWALQSIASGTTSIFDGSWRPFAESHQKCETCVQSIGVKASFRPEPLK